MDRGVNLALLFSNLVKISFPHPLVFKLRETYLKRSSEYNHNQIYFYILDNPKSGKVLSLIALAFRHAKLTIPLSGNIYKLLRLPL
jgi:hypothetical protein